MISSKTATFGNNNPKEKEINGMNINNNETTTTTTTGNHSKYTTTTNNNNSNHNTVDNNDINEITSEINHLILSHKIKNYIYLSIILSISLLFLIIYIPSYFKLDIIYIILPILFLSLPILFFEMYKYVKDFYFEKINEYSKNKFKFLFIFLLTFTIIVILLILIFFTFETLEHSYYGQLEEFEEMEVKVIKDLQKEILFKCYKLKLCNKRLLIEYLQSQLKSLYKKEKKINICVDKILNILNKNNGFVMITGRDLDIGYPKDEIYYRYMYPFKPLFIFKYKKEYHWHDRIQNFFRRVTKGFGLTHD
ncbi:hypothetical protein ABK040_004540 [Willaertia magna]